MSRSVRLGVIIAAIVVLLGGGAYAAVVLTRDHVDKAIPQTDLFGPSESPAGSPTPAGSPSPPPGSDIKGPLNILILGLDTRESIPTWFPRTDAIMILHVDKDLQHAWLTSLPRDLVVSIPAFAPARFSGSKTKINAAMAFGSRVPGQNRPNIAQGFQLTAKTVGAYTGIARFDAGAILTFHGLQRLVEALGGVDLYVDQKTTSIHRQPNGLPRPECGHCPHGYTGPQMTYQVGQTHMNGWMALDYARTRYIDGGDYTRQRHQRQLIEAIIGKAMSTDLFTNPATFAKILDALGGTLTFDGRGRKPSEFAYALRHLAPAAISQVGFPGSGVYSGSGYLGEKLDGSQVSYFAALRQDNLAAWAAAHAKQVNVGSRA